MLKHHNDIPSKANLILHLILIAMLLIVVRIWHLSVIQYDQRLEDSIKPQRKTVIEPATRATIRDRFNLPLAINKVSYEATLLYSQIRDIPAVSWQTNSMGEKVKILKRRAYIHDLALMLGKELDLDSNRLEDLIHSKASYYSHVPFVVKKELSEREYYRLKIIEADWPGIHMRKLPRRYYPHGRSAADVIGYMGAINKVEYEKILHEIKALEQLIADHDQIEDSELSENGETIEQVRRRLGELIAKSYSMHDYIGKTGVEGFYEDRLRGCYGKKSYQSDPKGNFLRELPGSHAPQPGHRVLLSLSVELQEYAEQLLAQNESLRITRKSALTAIKKTVIALKEPWIKGGAIVAMIPDTGEVVALASYPRYNPNDFIATGQGKHFKEKQIQINRWFENDRYLALLWDQQQPLKRERFDQASKQFYDEERSLTWQSYLAFILPEESALKRAIGKIQSLDHAIRLQLLIDQLMTFSPTTHLYAILNHFYCEDPHQQFGESLKGIEKQTFLSDLEKVDSMTKNSLLSELNVYFQSLPQNYDKVLLVDLCRLSVDHHRFSPELLAIKGKVSLADYHNQRGALISVITAEREKVKEQHHQESFKEWRRMHETEFLKTKRLEEKQSKTFPKPYLDYLDQEERRQFQQFWDHNSWNLIYDYLKNTEEDSIDSASSVLLQHAIEGLSQQQAIDYLKTMRSYEELTRPLLGRYRGLRGAKKPLEKDLAAAFYPLYGFGFGRSYAYRQASIQGSLFKLITAYEALIQQFKKLKREVISPQDLNPLVMVDQVYDIGKVRHVGYTEDGRPIPQLYKGGRLPRSVSSNYGRMDLTRAIEVSSNPYFSLVAAECLENLDDLSKAAKLFSYGAPTGIDLPGEIGGKVPTDLASNRTGLYAMAIGQHTLVVTPLQTAVMLAAFANGGKIIQPKIVKLTAAGNQENQVNVAPVVIKRKVPMPEIIRQILLRALKKVSLRTHQEGMTSLSRLYKEYPEATRQFSEFKDQLLGKTSTSESVEIIDLDLHDGTNIYTHVWFGSIAFQPTDDKNRVALLLKDEFGKPELIVVVYLRYGGYGKEAAPLAAQILAKWREIKQKYEVD
jgi:cell division protein FtsI/penicillin-binding protein 2